MMKNLKVGALIVCASGFLFTGCFPAKAEKTLNPKKNLQIELLTELEGQKIYRINDGMSKFYLTDQRSCISYNQPVGKITVPRMITHGENITFKQEGNEIIMEVRFKLTEKLEE